MNNQKIIIIVTVLVLISSIVFFALRKKEDNNDEKEKFSSKIEPVKIEIPTEKIGGQTVVKKLNPFSGEGLEMVQNRSVILAANQAYLNDVIFDVKAFQYNTVSGEVKGYYDKLIQNWGVDNFPYIYEQSDAGGQLNALKRSETSNTMKSITDSNNKQIRIPFSEYSFWGELNERGRKEKYINESKKIATRLLADSEKVKKELEKRALRDLTDAGLQFIGINA